LLAGWLATHPDGVKCTVNIFLLGPVMDFLDCMRVHAWVLMDGRPEQFCFLCIERKSCFIFFEGRNLDSFVFFEKEPQFCFLSMNAIINSAVIESANKQVGVFKRSSDFVQVSFIF
jgi:hypothetical protein